MYLLKVILKHDFRMVNELKNRPLSCIGFFYLKKYVLGKKLLTSVQQN